MTIADESIVFLVDCDNTLLDNDRVQDDFSAHLAREFGTAARDRYWAIFQDLFEELGYADYLGALQKFRDDAPHDARLLQTGALMLDYPFAERLYPDALAALARLNASGTTVLLSDGDVVFQPRKIERAGLWQAVAGRVLIYIHKERMLSDVERLYPASHYVMVDDKLRVLHAMKQQWGERLTTVFPRQGHYAHDTSNDAVYGPADITIEHIGDLLHLELASLRHAGRTARTNQGVEP